MDIAFSPIYSKKIWQNSLAFSHLCLVDVIWTEQSIECLFWFFQPTWKADLKVVQITKNDFFWVNASLKYFKCAPNCKPWLHLKKINSNKYLTFNAQRFVKMTWTNIRKSKQEIEITRENLKYKNRALISGPRNIWRIKNT